MEEGGVKKSLLVIINIPFDLLPIKNSGITIL